MLLKKVLLSSLFLISSVVLAFSQSVTVHGTVTNDMGDPEQDIVILATAWFSDSSVVMITMTTDGAGQYSGSLASPGPDIHGWLEVSMVDCWGTTITQNFEIFTGSEDFTADFNYCEDFMMDSCLVIILEEWNPGNEYELVAWSPPGETPTYLWSTGDTTQSIFPQESGQYCVTATFPNCTWEDCVEVQFDSNGVCFVYITITQENDSVYVLNAIHSGNNPVEYFWSNGDTTQTIVVGPGTYCVAAFDADGCGDTTCVILDDFEFCEVYVWENPNGGLVAEGFGEPPLTYVWSTGETTQTIFPNAEGLYCVTATDVNGCSASSCYQYNWGQDTFCFVYIHPILSDSNGLALQAVGYTDADTWLYTWSTGETSETIYPSDPDATYCVTMTDSNGCETDACFDFADYCYAGIDVQYVDTNVAILSVWIDSIFYVPGAPEPAYLWSTGDTSPLLTVNESGEYCVTVTIGNTCVTESCTYIDFDSIGMDCSVWVYAYPDSMGNWVAYAQPWGAGTFTYEWTNGETTQEIELESPNEFMCVTVTSSFGCEATACVDSLMQLCDVYINVSYENDIAVLTASVWSYDDPISLDWSTGETGYEITVDESGTYCVVLTTPTCVFTACAEVFFWNVDSCGVFISYDTDSIEVLYTANPWGVPPFTYLWSNGGTTQSVVINPGEPHLCVTVTDASGCEATACTYPLDSCDISIYYSDDPVPSLHISSLDPIIEVVWSTGDSSEWIEVPGPGTYCAEVTTSFGCYEYLCYTIDSIPIGLQNVIEGAVFGDTLSHANGWVTFYAYVPNSVEPFIAVDSVPLTPNGGFQSAPLPDGLYLAKAVLTPGSEEAQDYLPTYHLNATNWHDAIPISLPKMQSYHDIFMVPTTDFNGGGVIGGVVTDGNDIMGHAGPEVRGGSAGLPGVEIIISNAQGEPLHYTWTQEDGAYIFENLPLGTYRITYDVPGLSSPEIWVTLTAENPERLQINIEIEGGTVAVKDLDTEEVILFPNPAREEINIPVPVAQTTYQVQLVDMQGRIMEAGSVNSMNGIIHIDVRSYAPGLYYVQLTDDRVMYYGRFIKQD